jgi:hypothetical protein
VRECVLRSCRPLPPPPYAERCMQAHQPLYTFFFIKTSALMACKSDFHSLIRTESAFWCSWPVGSIGSTRNVLKPTSKAELLTRPRISVFRLTRLLLQQIHFQTRSLTFSLARRPSLSLPPSGELLYAPQSHTFTTLAQAEREYAPVGCSRINLIESITQTFP